jgi:hypothetical protein
MNDNTNVLLVVGALVIGVAVGLWLCPDVPVSVIPPYVDAGSDIMLNECCSARLTCKGYDPSGGSVTYHWTTEDGKGSFIMMLPCYTLPTRLHRSADAGMTLHSPLLSRTSRGVAQATAWSRGYGKSVASRWSGVVRSLPLLVV